MEEIEEELGIQTYPVNWPIGSGKEFKGVFMTEKTGNFSVYSQQWRQRMEVGSIAADLNDTNLEELIGSEHVIIPWWMM